MKRLAKSLLSALAVILLVVLGYGIAEWMATPPRFDLSQIEFSHALREEKDMPVVEVFFRHEQQRASWRHGVFRRPFG